MEQPSVGFRLSEDDWFAYNTIPYIFRFLDAPDLLQCGSVCKLWHHIASDSICWRSVNIRNCRINFTKMADFLSHQNTVDLKMVDCNYVSKELSVFTPKNIPSLRTFDASDCPSKVLEHLDELNQDLEVVSAGILGGANALAVDLNFLSRMPKLHKLQLICNRRLKNFDQVLTNLRKLRNLILLKAEQLDFKAFHSLNKNSTLVEFTLGNCDSIPAEFPSILKYLTALQKLRLDNCTHWDPISFFQGINELKSLTSLKIIDFAIKEDFEVGIKVCTNLKEFTVVPKARIASMINYNSRIMTGVKYLQNLKKFTWGFTKKQINYNRDELGREHCELVLENENRIMIRHWDFLKKDLMESMIGTEIIVNMWVDDC